MKRSEDKKRKWSQDLTKHFLEIYEQYPSLWDITHVDYKDRDQKKSALKQIVDAMIAFVPDFDVVSAKAKIRSIRNAYTLELHKVTKSKKNGTSAVEVYKPTVSWFGTADRFLRNVVQTRTNEPNFSLNDNEHYNSDAVMDNSVLHPSKRLKKLLSTDQLPKLNDGDNKVSQGVKTSDDDFDIFGRGVAGHLRNLPLRKALECQAFIQNYLIQQRLNHLEKATPTQSETSLSPFYPHSDSNESSLSYEYPTPSVHVHELKLERPTDVS